MLNNSSYTDQFTGGDLIQSVLPAAGCHRWHAPVDGVVRQVDTVPGLVFSVAEPAAAVAANTRGLMFIESTAPSIGMVCVIAVGISEVSSITMTARVGQQVNRGDELGYFSYGGSSHCLVFQPAKKISFDERLDGDHAPIVLNSGIASVD